MVLALLSFGVSAGGCGTDEEHDPDSGSDSDVDGDTGGVEDTTPVSWDITGPPILEIGTGFPEFESLEDGQDVPIIQGIQGGYHVWGGFRVSGIQPDGVQIRFELLDGDDVVARAVYEDDIGRAGPVNPGEAADGADPIFEYAAVAVIFGPEETRDISLVDQANLLLTLSLTDRDGTEATDSINLRAVCCEL